jgi:hypothetical protein
MWKYIRKYAWCYWLVFGTNLLFGFSFLDWQSLVFSLIMIILIAFSKYDEFK